jgi:hypothetical protein
MMILDSLFHFLVKKLTDGSIRALVNYLLKCGRELYINFKVWFIGLNTDRYAELVEKVIPVLHDAEDNMRQVEERLEQLSDDMMNPEDCLEIDISQNEWVNEEILKEGKVVKELALKQRKKIRTFRRGEFERAIEAQLRLKHWNVDANRMNENAINHSARLLCDSYQLNMMDTFATVMRVVPRVLVPNQNTMDALSIIYNQKSQNLRLRAEALRKSEMLPLAGMK